MLLSLFADLFFQNMLPGTRTIKVSNGLDHDRHSVSPHLNPNCLKIKVINEERDGYRVFQCLKSYVVDNQKNRLDETVLLSIQNICLFRCIKAA